MRETKPFIKMMPFIMLAICAAMCLFVHEPWYGKAYRILSQVIGFSIATNAYKLYFIRRHKMCNYSLVATIGLLSLNMLDLVNVVMPMPEFYGIYNVVVTYFALVLTALFYIFEKYGASTK